MRRQRNWLARWLVAIILLPLLIGVLPEPTLSAETALARDLAISVCSPSRDDHAGGQGNHGPAHEQQCIVCSAGCPACAPSLPDSQLLSFPSVQAETTRQVADREFVPFYGVLRHGSPPRGPPSFWMI